jgi:Flp pilus assembly protein TadG
VFSIRVRHTSRRDRRRGQALVEFALVFPIFMLVLSGIMDFGFMLYSRMSVINASREGAHAAIVTAPNYANITTVATGAAISAAAQGGVSISAGNVSVSCLATSVSVTSPATIPCGSATAKDSVVVTVNYGYHSFFPLSFGATLTLTSTTQMVIE